MTDNYILSLVEYAVRCGLIENEDKTFAVNRLLEVMQLDALKDDASAVDCELHEILEKLTDDAVARGVCEDNGTARELFDTKLMGVLTPFPHEVRKTFKALYAENPEKATDWFYKLSQDTNYIRRDRIAKDKKWKYDCAYGQLDITINLSKPEKDPRAIAAAKLAPQSGYPKCLLCVENEGYAGRMNHPARQNHRIIPMHMGGCDFFMQYSPYVYYNEHCIVFNSEHTAMKIDRAVFGKLLDFVEIFPHYMLGSNADLPIVGGSILSHDHYQGGRYTFAMETVPVEKEIVFKGFEDVKAGIVKWPMSVIRLMGEKKERLIDLADKILGCWRGYTDEEAFIFAHTGDTPHNTITPIARMKDGAFQLDLVLRNNITTQEHPLGVYHPHEKLHHIKKENIGLIEVMGLAVLPSRLDKELELLKEAILSGADLAADEVLSKHAAWAEELKKQYTFTAENAMDILKQEVGKVFMQVLCDAGVYKRTEAGQNAFLRFVNAVNE